MHRSLHAKDQEAVEKAVQLFSQGMNDELMTEFLGFLDAVLNLKTGQDIIRLWELKPENIGMVVNVDMGPYGILNDFKKNVGDRGEMALVLDTKLHLVDPRKTALIMKEGPH
jgi:hypothetical protein